MKLNVIAMTGLLFFASAVPASAAFTIFTGVGVGQLRSDWEAGVGGVYFEEDFAGNAYSGFTLTAIGTGHTGFGVSSNRFNDRLTSTNSTEINFAPDSIYAFGANWNLNPGGEGIGIRITAGTETLSVEIPRTHTGQFFGFISTVAFSKIVLTGGTQQGSAETYNADNFVWAAAPVPEPVSLAMWCLGAFGAAAHVRRRQRSLSKQAA